MPRSEKRRQYEKEYYSLNKERIQTAARARRILNLDQDRLRVLKLANRMKQDADVITLKLFCTGILKHIEVGNL